MYTPSQTVGPYFAYGLTPEQYQYPFNSILFPSQTASDDNVITLRGAVYDGNNHSIEDAMLELWQNDGENTGLVRAGTGVEEQNRFIFNINKPKGFEDNAPFVSVILFMRGQLIHSYTRIYFEDEEKSNNNDPTLRLVPKERRHTLIAKVGSEANTYEFDIHMQGDHETVFFDLHH